MTAIRYPSCSLSDAPDPVASPPGSPGAIPEEDPPRRAILARPTINFESMLLVVPQVIETPDNKRQAPSMREPVKA